MLTRHTLRLALLAVAAPFVLLGCPDKATTNPSTAASDGGATTATTASAAPAAPAASAKSGGW